MPAVVVAGGLGDMGRLITDALIATGNHTVYVMTRKIPSDAPEHLRFLETDYSKDGLLHLLNSHGIQVVICTFSLHYDAASEAQLRLIEASEAASSVHRFMPSEFNVDYDLPDDILPYPDKKYHRAARRALEATTSLEYTYIYPGMFMDYFGIPKIPTHLRELCLFIDPIHLKAAVPNDGSCRMAMSFTTDVARYTALAVDLETWPRVMTTATSTVSINRLVELAEENLGEKLVTHYQDTQNLLDHTNVVLPENERIADAFPRRFPGGREQLRALVADLEAGVALGAFEFGGSEKLDLVDVFKGSPMTIEVLMEKAWKR